MKKRENLLPRPRMLATLNDANSNVTRIVDASNTNSSKTVDYTYDDLNRLLSATATSVASGQSTYTHSYTYNAIGNILTRTDSAGTYAYAGDQGSSNANPHAVTSIGSNSYTYDNNGNMLTETSGLSNTWDYNNHLTQAVKGGITSTYAYDHSGQRVKLANGTTTTYYPSQFYNTDGTTPVKHILTPGGQSVATVKGTGAGASVFSVHTDHLTGSSVVTNSGGTQEELMDYFPFGNVRLDQKAGSFGEKKQFAGSEFDADSGLNYMEARYYHSTVGRFVSQDPLFLDMGTDLAKYQKELAEILGDPQKLNSYSYVENNPLKLIDPTGEASTWAYFSHPVRTSREVAFWYGVATSATVAGRPLTGALLSHSVSYNPGSVNITEQNQKNYGNAINTIKSTSQYQDLINKSIENAKNGTYQTTGGLEFNNGDLFTGLHGANAQVNVANNNGQWDIDVTITDRYDFKKQSYRGFTDQVNNLAVQSQEHGSITTYDIRIKFKDRKK